MPPHRPTPLARLPHSSAAAACAAAALAAACAPSPHPANSTPVPIADASPAVRGGENGLEVSWWAVTPDSAAIARALFPYTNFAIPADADQLALWRANGVRVVAVPLGRLDSVRAALPIAGSVNRQWLGQVPLWTETVAGPAWQGRLSLALDNGSISLGPGRLRVLSRCWTVPLPPPSADADSRPLAALLVELLVQHKEARPRLPDPRAALTRDPSLGMEEEGVIFRRLVLSIAAAPGFAYLLIPENPHIDWETLARTPPDNPRPQPSADRPPRLGEVVRDRDTDAAFVAAADPHSDLPAGPPSPAALRLGEALLVRHSASLPSLPTPGRGDMALPDRTRQHAVVVLVPRVPEEFRLLR